MRLIGFLKKLKKEESSEQGQAIVEFALALPVLLMIICGILDFGWIYVNSYRVEQAAFTGSRYVTIHGSELSSGELEDNVKQAVAGNLPDGSPEHVSLDINDVLKQVTINVNYPVKTITFVAGTIFGSYYNASLTNVAYY